MDYWMSSLSEPESKAAAAFLSEEFVKLVVVMTTEFGVLCRMFSENDVC